VQGGSDGRTGGVWVWPQGPDGFQGLLPMGDDAYRDAEPIGGRLDPDTHAPSAEGEYVYPFRVPTWHTEPGTVLRVRNNGGGGYGDPLDRELEAVKRDVRDGYVTIAGAARDYGVVVSGDPDLDPENLVVDEGATADLRAQMRADRPSA
jgi:N-methylhydantoinase B